MSLISLESLIENKVYIGHNTVAWDPRTAHYMRSASNGYFFMDVITTAKMLTYAYAYLFKMAKRGKTFLFVGTKETAKPWIKKAATCCGSFYVNQVWRSGLLTNWTFLYGRIRLLAWFNRIFATMQERDMAQSLPKGLVLSVERRYFKLSLEMNGLIGLRHIPDSVIIVDPGFEQQALKECIKLRRVLIALLDSDCNPERIHIPIPGNDDHPSSIKTVLQILSTAVLRGKLVRYYVSNK